VREFSWRDCNDKPGSITVTARISRSLQTPRNLPLSSRFLPKDVLGYDLAGFFQSHSDQLKKTVMEVLDALLTPQAPPGPPQPSLESPDEPDTEFDL
jgi:hypothetical protein